MNDSESCAKADSSLPSSDESQSEKPTTGNTPPSDSETVSDLTMFTCQMPKTLRRGITKARKRDKARSDSEWARGVFERETVDL